MCDHILVHATSEVVLSQPATRLIIGALLGLDALQVSGNDVLALSWANRAALGYVLRGARPRFAVAGILESWVGLPSWSSGKLPRSGLMMKK